MIITKTVSMKWNGKTKQHYLDKGYKYTKMGDSFDVSVEHLTKSSFMIIDVKCDYCGAVVSKKYSDYNKYEKVVDKDACVKCSHLKSNDVLLVKHGKDGLQKLRADTLKPYQDSKKLTMEFVSEQFELAGLPLVGGQDYKGTMSNLKFICETHGIQEMSFSSMYHQGNRCNQCRFASYKAKGNPRWNGGVREIYQHFRDIINDWQSDIYKASNGKCLISGNKATEVHHIYPFKNIVDDIFKETGLPRLQSVGDYSESELSLLDSKCLELHNKPNVGACLAKDVHFLFHQTYGYTGNTPEQFAEFVKLHKVVA